MYREHKETGLEEERVVVVTEGLEEMEEDLKMAERWDLDLRMGLGLVAVNQ